MVIEIPGAVMWLNGLKNYTVRKSSTQEQVINTTVRGGQKCDQKCEAGLKG